MDLKDYEYWVLSESCARRFLLGFCFKNHQRFCPRCSSRKIYRLRDKRRRCSQCKYTFRDFSGRWINNCKISCQDWLRIIKLFELEVPTYIIARQVALNYETTWKAVMAIRTAIFFHAQDAEAFLSGEIELGESYFGGKRKGNRGRGAAGKIPVFGVLERHGIVHVTPVPDVTAQTLLTQTVDVVKRGSIVYTDKFKSYDALMFCGYKHLKVDHNTRFKQGKVHINGLEGFWSYAKRRIAKHHGIKPHNFPYYLKEQEYRYNNRHHPENIYPQLCKYTTNLVPKHG